MTISRDLTNAIVCVYEANRNDTNRERMEAYMKNHFSFFGIKAPEQKKLLTPILKEYKTISEPERFETARLLFQQNERECHYAALTLLEKGMKKMPEYAIDVYKELLVTNSWWDTVDMIAAKLCGHYFLTYPSKLEPVTKKWRQSDNLWVRRSSVLHQLKYKEQTQEELLFDTVRVLKDEREFFIEKAIGWALREYSKTDADAVQTFLATTDVRPLSRREGLKWVKNNGLLKV
ncbi:DNA alkylation repair protein [Halobacillus locisalis]|uniref:DNA alkylation repair protein n=1 Tax=Halobacillus locisalis TaxID=220753 RepID=A0A838CQH3_9BACI|nr:DNA alkylation repair protein [Halobacillus locisalis]MBA2174362.1 DNA alkylation repair protein [Halobacillus locisalis]